MFNKPRKWAVLMGIYAQVLFVLSWILFGFIQGAHYSWAKDSISDMYAVGAPHGEVLVILFTLCGAMTILYLAFGLWPNIKRVGMGAKVGTILLTLSIYGLGDLLSPIERLGCRMADLGCTANAQVANFGGKADELLSSIGILLFIAGVITIGYSVKQLKDWNKARTTLLIGGYLFFPLLLLQGFLSDNFGGGGERLIAFLGAALLYVMATRCYRSLEG